jgi:hypothetical protein
MTFKLIYTIQIRLLHINMHQSYFSDETHTHVRERPFNLKGGLWLFSKKNILIPNVAEKNILILVEEKKII